MSLPTCRLYRCFASDGRLLYVGISAGVKDRLKAHRRAAPWYPEMARVTVSDPMPWTEAYEVEQTAIATEKPAHNRPAAWKRAAS